MQINTQPINIMLTAEISPAECTKQLDETLHDYAVLAVRFGQEVKGAAAYGNNIEFLKMLRDVFAQMAYTEAEQPFSID